MEKRFKGGKKNVIFFLLLFGDSFLSMGRIDNAAIPLRMNLKS